jgi:hypothetical protein
VFDLGLSNRTFAVHDLAVALERSTVDWLDLAGTGLVAACCRTRQMMMESTLAVRMVS